VISRLQQIQIVANDINTVSRDLSSVYEVSLEPFSPLFQKLLLEYAAEYEKYRLDEIVVAAIAPVMRRMATSWIPLEEPTFFLDTFRSWRRALKINDETIQPETQLDIYGTKTTVVKPVEEYVIIQFTFTFNSDHRPVDSNP
jgi:tuftelin-interacting protein 11